jgi:hypothetical protein
VERTRKEVLTIENQCFSLEIFSDLILEINSELKKRMKASVVGKTIIR